MTIARILLIMPCLAIGGCGLWDSGIEWRGGPYILIWIDDPSTTTLSYDLGEGTSVGRVDEVVFSVGWDGRYAVAKQHPAGDKNVTNYFFIDSSKDHKYADPPDVVVGPLDENEFRAKKKELGLPEFSKTLASLQ